MGRKRNRKKEQNRLQEVKGKEKIENGINAELQRK
jgi:hypothetical protein